MEIEFTSEGLRLCREILLKEWRMHPKELLKVARKLGFGEINLIKWLIIASAEETMKRRANA